MKIVYLCEWGFTILVSGNYSCLASIVDIGLYHHRDGAVYVRSLLLPLGLVFRKVKRLKLFRMLIPLQNLLTKHLLTEFTYQIKTKPNFLTFNLFIFFSFRLNTKSLFANKAPEISLLTLAFRLQSIFQLFLWFHRFYKFLKIKNLIYLN